jgi:hypothetical protein
MPDNLTGQETHQEPAKPTFDWNSLLDPTNGKIMGKYDPAHPEEFVKGYWELTNGAAALARENQTYKELTQTLASRNGPEERDRQRRPEYEANLQTLGIPIDDLDQMITNRAERIVKNQFEPLMRTMQARTEVAQDNPAYLNDEAKVMQFVQRSPTLQAEFNDMAVNNPRAALKYAYAMYRESVPRETAAGSSAGASLPQNLGGGGGNSAQQRTPFMTQGNREQDLERALAYKRQTNEVQPFLDAWFKDKPLTWSEQLAAQMKESQ